MAEMTVRRRDTNRTVQIIVSVVVLLMVAAGVISQTSWRSKLPDLWGEHYVSPGAAYYKSGMEKMRYPFTTPGAMADFDEATKLDPDSPEPYYGRALGYERYGALQKALEQLNKALALRADFFDALVRRGGVYRNLQEFDLALADLNKAASSIPQDAKVESKYNLYFNRCIVLYVFAKLEQALADCSEAIQLLPDVADTYSTRGLIYFENNQMIEAVADYRKLLELDPSFDLQGRMGADFQKKLAEITDPAAKAALQGLLEKLAAK